MQTAGELLGHSLPYFNLILVLIVIFFLIRIILIKNRNTYITPWKFLLFAIIVYTIEELLTVIHISGALPIPKIVFPLMEMIIICSFIYMVMLQKKYTDMQS